MVVIKPQIKIDVLHNQLQRLLPGVRKDGKTPVFRHSLNVGERLATWEVPAHIKLAGYYHDLMEDVPEIANLNTKEEKLISIVALAEEVGLSSTDAASVAQLVWECSYTPDEYRMEKFDRKRAAVKRWKHSDNSVKLIKTADILDNRRSMLLLTQDFRDDYDFWALGLLVSFMHDFGEVVPSCQLFHQCGRASERILASIL